MVDIPVAPHQREAERLRTGQHTFAMRSDLMVYGQAQTGMAVEFNYEDLWETPNLMEALNEALQAVQQTTLPPRRRFAVDPDRIDELVDWALSQDWEPDEGERIRREAWRNESD